MLVYMVLHLLASLAALPRTDARDFIGKNTKKPLHNKTSRPHFSTKNRPLNQFNQPSAPLPLHAYRLNKHPLESNYSQLFTQSRANTHIYNILLSKFRLFTFRGVVFPGE